MSKLYLITWEGDFTQFLVSAEDKDKAIQYAIEANKEIGWDEDEDFKYIENIDSYEIEEAGFETLKELVKRTDYMFSTENVIVYNG